jgi:eukaryotic-like serine/threonine-protein kinase
VKGQKSKATVTLTSGARLGPYEVQSPIGAGGMGEVYRARDTRLDRAVAIKLLPASFADRPERRERFRLEARAISSLQHPHICTLFDVGEQDGQVFLVLEYLEGETLDDRLIHGPLPAADVLRYATQIAGALDHAHRARIVHGNLKPSNVMLTESGAKLLDFGLAMTPALAATATSTTASFAHNKLTVEGTLIGTFEYMAPEQLEGKQADARTDIFALGAVLYEMATGRKAFEGESQASLIASILTEHPPAITSTRTAIDSDPAIWTPTWTQPITTARRRWSSHGCAAIVRRLNACWTRAHDGPFAGLYPRRRPSLPASLPRFNRRRQ